MEMTAVPSESFFSMWISKHDHNNYFLKMASFKIPSSNIGRNHFKSLLRNLIGHNRFIHYQKQRECEVTEEVNLIIQS